MTDKTIKKDTGMHPDADHNIDLSGMITPIATLKVTQIFRDMERDETLEIVGRDPDSRTNLFQVLPSSSYDLIISEDMDSSYRVVLKKRKEI